MKILSINNCNTNFNGKIKSSPILEEIKSHASKESIAKFEEMSKKINTINDGLIFDISKTKKYKMSKNEVSTIYSYNLHRTNNENKKELICNIEENINTFSTPETIKQRKASILDVITNFFENVLYAEKGSSNNPKLKEELKNNINK